MSDDKTAQASVRLPANVMKDFREAVALKKTTVQQVLEQAVRVYLVSARIADKK